MKFSVFGSNGFIGSNMINFLRNQKIEYDVLEPNNKKVFEKSLGHVIYCIGITSDFRKKPFETIESHVCVLQKILKNCKYDSFLYLSSSRVYLGSTSTNETDQLLVNPNNLDDLYNISKLMGESLCLSSNFQNVRIARLSNVIGENMKNNDFLASILHDAVFNKKIILHTKPNSEKDYVCIDDVIKILYKIALQGKEKIYNIASGKNTKVREITNKINDLTGCEIQFASDAIEQSFSQINIKRIQNEFGFKPTFVLNELEKIISTYKNKTK